MAFGSHSGMKLGTRLSLVLILLGGVLIFSSIGSAIKLYKGDIHRAQEMEVGSYRKGDMVEGDIYYVYGVVAELETTRKTYGITTGKSTSPYYLVSFVDDEGYYMCDAVVHTANKEDISKLESLNLATNKFLDDEGPDPYETSTPLHLEMRVDKMEDELRRYLYEGLEVYTDAERAEVDSYTVDGVLEKTIYRNVKITPIIGGVLVLLPIVLLIISRRRMHAYKSNRTHYVNEGPTTDQLMNEYNQAPVYAQNNANNGNPGVMKRYSPNAYENPTDYTPGQMDSINPDDYFKK